MRRACTASASRADQSCGGVLPAWQSFTNVARSLPVRLFASAALLQLLIDGSLVICVSVGELAVGARGAIGAIGAAGAGFVGGPASAVVLKNTEAAPTKAAELTKAAEPTIAEPTVAETPHSHTDASRAANFTSALPCHARSAHTQNDCGWTRSSPIPPRKPRSARPH
jgi:hypothetical protein